MASGNLAVTKDGQAYNKLQRPDNYLDPATPLPPSLPAATPPTTHSSKRKLGKDATPGNKRFKANGDRAYPAYDRTRLGASGPPNDCGMRTMLPGLDDEEQLSDDSMNEALAYLRGVR